MNAKLRRAVRERAGGRCEYCRLPEGATAEPFSTDHIIAEQHLGPTSLENLAYACAHCNRHKGPNIAGIDPRTGILVQLFSPRASGWSLHFAWSGTMVEGLTPIGRATVLVLNMNHPERVLMRELLIQLGEFPSAGSGS